MLPFTAAENGLGVGIKFDYNSIFAIGFLALHLPEAIRVFLFIFVFASGPPLRANIITALRPERAITMCSA